MNYITVTRALIVATILCLGVPALAEVHGVLRVVKGDVQIKSGSTGVQSRAKLGQEVYPKDTIITGKEARAKIVMIDNNELNVSPDSHIEIQNYEYNPTENKKNVLLNVLYGKVRSKVEQKYDGKTSKFQVKTPSAVAGVRGTDFVASYDQGTQKSSVVTFRGAVEFGLPGANGSIRNSVSVTPGKIAESSGGSAPSTPSNVPKAQLAKMDNDTKADGGNAKGDPRAPASKGGSSSNSNGSSNSSGASNSPSSAPGGASMSPGSANGPGVGSATGMLSSNDLASAPASTGIVSQIPVAPQIVNGPPSATGPPPQQVCQTCNQQIQNSNQKSALTVHVAP